MKNYIKVFVLSLFVNSLVLGSGEDFFQEHVSRIGQQLELQAISYDDLTLIPCLYYTWRDPERFLTQLGLCGSFAKYPMEMSIMISASVITTTMLLSIKYALRNHPNVFAKGFSTACGIIFLGEAFLK